jgi:RNA polymerase sigma-70 factor (ECF subfamily)
LAGDPEAKAEIVRDYQELVYNLALKLLNDGSEAENVLQETFLKVFEKLNTFRRDSSLQTWIYRIATNTALMSLRQRKGELIPLEGGTDLSPDPKYAQMMKSLDRDPLELLLDAEFKQALERAMTDLPDSQRIPFVLKDIEGLSLQEVADSLNTTVPAVKASLHRGRSTLRDSLADLIEQRRIRPSGKEKSP